MVQTLQLREALQEAVVMCSERCLYQSAKWAAELLNAIRETPADDVDAKDAAQDRFISVAFARNPDPDEAALEAAELNRYLLAKSLFDCKEFDRCAAVFLPDSLLAGLVPTTPRPEEAPTTAAGKAAAAPAGDRPGAAIGHSGTSPASESQGEARSRLPRLSQKSLFLALYAKMISGEKRKDEDAEMVMGPHDLGSIVNKQLVPVSGYLEQWFAERTGEDGEVVGSQGWLEYLFGMVLAKSKSEAEAMQWFIRSVHLFPMNWGCWLEMTSLITRVADLNQISPQLPQNIVSYMFHLHTSLELYQQGPNLAHSLDELLKLFPTSSFLLTCKALLEYHNKDLILAEQHFSTLLALHPHRLDSLDHYSNILYVLNYRPKLAFLAHLCSSVDKFRPESCVVVGNYYSLLSMHEKAVQYFRRALTLDRSCLSAWTLMGHEYVELKNTHAAIESYRRAVDVNRRDYRAWYGLGQTYEVLEMHTYALWYYKKAAGLRPWDGKMWMAVGSCLQKMGRERDGIKALKRALLADSSYDSGSGSGLNASAAGGGSSFGVAGGLDRAGAVHMDPEVLLQIASMYDSLGDYEEARMYMELCVAQEDGGGGDGDGLGESIAIHNDATAAGGSDDGDGARAEGRRHTATGGGGGTGVTAATSKARMWLARHALEQEDYAEAHRLATELCQDGVEVEEAKALIRTARAQMDLINTQADGPSSLARTPQSQHQQRG
ncbi:anaphase-promoting complex subunit 8 [Gaeumannomyces tritici R3-111a-1]|uniref:Anaphase-promoting complex subunit 8 n=1 Tax=Gaeumannomyces tritici (strain R3-111a-1) TaxID=644352 RepID=J3P126_GAET3|nr:anaphase-promoting complex subunit 8 [Gaeumannomyces tritici R3-111a-1]EJT77311.1 anaphase-promoting complex subunit 8 [Gaeumannomyces tritici R3-111a-1]